MEDAMIIKIKEKIEGILKQTGRQGIGELLSYLDKTDFYTAPASARYHLSEQGGLAYHSLTVYNELMNLFSKGLFDAIDGWRSVAIASLLHDLCKIDMYSQEHRWRKNANNEWEQYPTYGYDEKFYYGHAEKSVYIASKLIRLEDEEAQAIRAHMGFSDSSFKGGDRTIPNIFASNELALYLSFADQIATFRKESNCGTKN